MSKGRGKGNEEAGFTLVELVLAMTISSIILGAVVAGTIVGLNTTAASTNRLNQSDDRQLLEIWLPRDIQSAQAATSGPLSSSACPVRSFGVPTGTNAVLVLTGSGVTVTTGSSGPANVTTDNYEADYVLSTAGTTQRLTRYFCDTASGSTSPTTTSSMIVAFGLTSGPDAAVASLPSSTPGPVALTLKDKSGSTFVVSGTERS